MNWYQRVHRRMKTKLLLVLGFCGGAIALAAMGLTWEWFGVASALYAGEIFGAAEALREWRKRE